MDVNDKDFIQKLYARELLQSRHAAPGPHPCVLVLDHLKAGHNVGKIIRTAHAFGCQEVHLVGVGVFDPRNAKGCLRKTHTKSFATFRESYETLIAQDFSIWALDAHTKAEHLGRAALPTRCAFVVGHEEFGLSFKAEEFPLVRRIKIPQFGEVESLNVSVAASIAVFEYLRQRVLAS